MNITSRSIIALCSLAPFALLCLAGAGPSKPHKRLPYSKISPLINSKCEPCHNAKQHPEGINLSSYSELMTGGEHGPIVVAGDPKSSKLIQYVDGEKQPRMPFKKPPLTASEIALLKKWVAAGAKG
jgi:hypothetical protein